jgi:D-3-phosphoglycerate dehydrogenase
VSARRTASGPERRPLVYVAQPVHHDALDELTKEARLAFGFGAERVPLEQVAPDVVAVLIRKAPFGRTHVDLCRQMRVIARAGVGFDNIDVAAATERGIAVCNVPDGNTVAVAEHVFALLLAVTRKVVLGDRYVRDGRFHERDALSGQELRSRRLGIVGFGRIGRQVAHIARQGFGMATAAFDPFLDARAMAEHHVQPAASLEELLSSSDLVTVHVPLTPQTRGLIGAAQLDLLPPGAVLVHTSRGGVIDEDALYRCLRSGRLAGAGIDVFEQEPPPPTHPFFGLDNIVLAPHVAGQTENSMREMALGAVRAVIAVLHGRRPEHLVNPISWTG